MSAELLDRHERWRIARMVTFYAAQKMRYESPV